MAYCFFSLTAKRQKEKKIIIEKYSKCLELFTIFLFIVYLVYYKIIIGND